MDHFIETAANLEMDRLVFRDGNFMVVHETPIRPSLFVYSGNEKGKGSLQQALSGRVFRIEN